MVSQQEDQLLACAFRRHALAKRHREIGIEKADLGEHSILRIKIAIAADQQVRLVIEIAECRVRVSRA